jgi:choline-glycine betaine transporter
MNLKCYKSVIRALALLLILDEGLKRMQQAALIAACCIIFVRLGC